MDDETTFNSSVDHEDLSKNLDDLSPKPPSQLNARSKIVDILTRVETRQSYTDKLLEKEIEEFGDEDRGLITEVVNGVLRWQYRLDWYLSQLYVGEYESLIPDVKNNLRSSGYQLMYLDKIPPYAVLNEAVEIAKTKYNQKTANLVNAILRNYLRQQKKLEFMELDLDYVERLAISYSHPLWLIQRWIEQWGIDETIELCNVNNQRPNISVRINHLMADTNALYRSLDENNISYEQHPDFPDFIWIHDFSELRKLDLLKKGWLSVQDISTAIPVQMLNPQPGEAVLDMCAAPGGKAGYIGEKMKNQGRLLAFEKHFNRSGLLRENLQRLGVQNAEIVNTDALQMPTNHKFDRVLLDAPCTGLGVLSKRVDLKWKRTMKDIENMKRLQLQLLEAAAPVVRTNGILVYSTCTIEVEENEKIIESFLEKHTEFQLDEIKDMFPEPFIWDKGCIRTFPHRHKMDGSYAVRLKKIPR